MQLQKAVGNKAVVQLMQSRMTVQRQPATIQRHLFVDTPDDFRQLEDLGMWWVMASEWKKQKTVRKDAVSKDPKDYITSLSNVGSAKDKIDDDEQINMVAHGYEGGKEIDVGGNAVEAADKKKEITDVYEDGGKRSLKEENFFPLYCYNGNKNDGLWNKQGRNGLGDGPLLMPSGNIVTVDMGTTDLSGWAGGTFIDGSGSWLKAADALGDLPKLKAYKEALNHDGELLAAALEQVFDKIKTEYDDFVKQVQTNGSAPNPWGV